MSQGTVSNLDETADVAHPVERRAAVRLQSNAKGSCQSLSRHLETDWQAVVRDISCTGIGLLLARRFEVGTLFTIELAGTPEGQTQMLVARVVHAALQQDGNWFFGCSFLSPLAEHELQSLIGTA